MEPKDLDPDDLLLLPDHEVVVYAKDQPEYLPLPVARLAGPEGRLISRWTLSAEERVQIAAGEDLYLEVLTFGGSLQPLLPTVGLRYRCAADPVVKV